MIENVGNLVCPAEFRVGEDAKAMVCSVTEGEDKPLKYPLMFRTCELVVVNKVDLLPHLDYDLDKLRANIRSVNPDAEVIECSARTGEGVERFRGWLLHEVDHALGREHVARVTWFAQRGRAAGASCAGRWRSGSSAAAGCWPRAPRRRRARTPATWPWSSCTR